MIEILVRHVDAEAFQTLALPPGINMSREIETTILNREPEVTDITWPFEIPMNDQNIIALGHPDVVANPTLRQRYVAQLIIDGVFLSELTLYVMRTSLSKKTISVTLVGDYGSFGAMVKDAKVSDLFLDGTRTIGSLRPDRQEEWPWPSQLDLKVFYTPCDSHEYMRSLADESVEDDFVFYPACDLGPNIEGVDFEGGRNLINIFHTFGSDSDRQYVDPIQHYITARGDFGGPGFSLITKDLYYWVPQFKLLYVLKKCFSEYGFDVITDLDSDDKFKKVTLYNTFAINSCIVSEAISGSECHIFIEHDATKIYPKNHMPKQTIVDFILSIAKVFNLQYVFDWTSKKVTVRRLTNATVLAGAIDLSQVVFPDPDIVFEDQNFTKGFSFAFESDPVGTLPAPLEEANVADFPFATSVDRYSDLAGVPAAGNTIAFVRQLNEYFQLDGATTWNHITHNLKGYATSTDTNQLEIKPKAVPLMMQEVNDIKQLTDAPGTTPWNSVMTFMSPWLMPISQMGIAGEQLLAMFKDPVQVDTSSGPTDLLGTFATRRARIEATYPHLCNWLGMHWCTTHVNDAGPLGQVVGYDSGSHGSSTFNSNSLACYGLAWNNPEGHGLYEDHWKTFVDVVTQSVVIECRVAMQIHMYRDIDFNQSVFRINDQYFLCKKATINMPFPNIATLQLVRL